tara:strand:- start:236 stop:490 length:255 start_codon:yes stop_codon:yes gene_type:complete
MKDKTIGFQLIHGSVVVIRQKTVYKQTEAYHRNGDVYAKAAGGFIKLSKTGKTTHPDIVWEECYLTSEIKKKQSVGYLEWKNES